MIIFYFKKEITNKTSSLKITKIIYFLFIMIFKIIIIKIAKIVSLKLEWNFLVVNKIWAYRVSFARRDPKPKLVV